MTRFLIFILLILAFKADAANITVMADYQGNLKAPTNFFRANSNLIAAVIAAGTGSGLSWVQSSNLAWTISTSLVTSGTNNLRATLTNGQPVIAAGKFVGDGSDLTGVNGTNVTAGTIQSNKLSADTLAMFGTGTAAGYASYSANGSITTNSYAHLNYYPSSKRRATPRALRGIDVWFANDPKDDTIARIYAANLVNWGLREHGYVWLNLPCFHTNKSNGAGAWTNDWSSGGFTIDTNRYPNITNLVRDLHAMGLKVRAYGEPEATVSSSTVLNVLGHEEEAARGWAAIGFDAIQYDPQNSTSETNAYIPRLQRMAAALDATGRTMPMRCMVPWVRWNGWGAQYYPSFSIGPWATTVMNHFAPVSEAGGADFYADAFWKMIFFSTRNCGAHPELIGQDFQPESSILNWVLPLAAYRAQFSMNCILPASFWLNSTGDIGNHGPILTNLTALSILDDNAYLGGFLAWSTDTNAAAVRTNINSADVWVKPLGNAVGPNYAACFINWSTNHATNVSFFFTNGGFSGRKLLTDVWNGSNFYATNSWTISVPTNSCFLYTISNAPGPSADVAGYQWGSDVLTNWSLLPTNTMIASQGGRGTNTSIRNGNFTLTNRFENSANEELNVLGPVLRPRNYDVDVVVPLEVVGPVVASNYVQLRVPGYSDPFAISNVNPELITVHPPSADHKLAFHAPWSAISFPITTPVWMGVLHVTNLFVNVTAGKVAVFGPNKELTNSLMDSAAVVDTNALNSAVQAATNGANALSLTRATDSTNYAGTVSGNASNAANALGLSRATDSTNYALSIGAAGTNFSRSVGTDGTNFARSVGADATNYAGAVSGNASNAANALGLSRATDSTNLARTMQIGSATLSNAVASGIVTNGGLSVTTNYANTKQAGSAALSNAVASTIVTNGTLLAASNALAMFSSPLVFPFAGKVQADHNDWPIAITPGAPMQLYTAPVGTEGVVHSMQILLWNNAPSGVGSNLWAAPILTNFGKFRINVAYDGHDYADVAMPLEAMVGYQFMNVAMLNTNVTGPPFSTNISSVIVTNWSPATYQITNVFRITGGTIWPPFYTNVTSVTVTNGSNAVITGTYLVTNVLNLSGMGPYTNTSTLTVTNGWSAGSITNTYQITNVWQPVAWSFDRDKVRIPSKYDTDGYSILEGNYTNSIWMGTLRWPLPYTNGLRIWITSDRMPTNLVWGPTVYATTTTTYQDSLTNYPYKGLQFRAEAKMQSAAGVPFSGLTFTVMSNNPYVLMLWSNVAGASAVKVGDVLYPIDPSCYPPYQLLTELIVTNIANTTNLGISCGQNTMAPSWVFAANGYTNIPFSICTHYRWLERNPNKRGYLASIIAGTWDTTVDWNPMIFFDQEVAPSWVHAGTEDAFGGAFTFATSYQGRDAGQGYGLRTAWNICSPWTGYAHFLNRPLRYTNGILGEISTLGAGTNYWGTIYYEMPSPDQPVYTNAHALTYTNALPVFGWDTNRTQRIYAMFETLARAGLTNALVDGCRLGTNWNTNAFPIYSLLKNRTVFNVGTMTNNADSLEFDGNSGMIFMTNPSVVALTNFCILVEVAMRPGATNQGPYIIQLAGTNNNVCQHSFSIAAASNAPVGWATIMQGMAAAVNQPMNIAWGNTNRNVVGMWGYTTNANGTWSCLTNFANDTCMFQTNNAQATTNGAGGQMKITTTIIGANSWQNTSPSASQTAFPGKAYWWLLFNRPLTDWERFEAIKAMRYLRSTNALTYENN